MAAPKERIDADDGVMDKGGLAEHMNYCEHVEDAIDIPLDIAVRLKGISMENGKNGDVICSMDGCDKGECWLCLKCHKVLCGRYGNQHMITHYVSTQTEHCMAMGVNDLSFWCYKCENYINHLSVKKVWDFYSVAHIARFGEEIPAQLLSKTTFGKQELQKGVIKSLLPSHDLKGIAEYIKADKCKKIGVLAGAGISVAAGIPGKNIFSSMT